MKIIRNDVCYVETSDLYFIGKFPNRVTEEIPVVIESNYIKFENKESIEYWQQKESVLDYDAVSCLTDEELTTKIIEIESTLEKLCAKWLYTSEYYRRNLNQNHEYNQQIKKLEFLLKTLKDYQQNRKQFDTAYNQLIISKQNQKRIGNQ